MARIAVLMGGRSREREISLLSGKAVAGALRRLGHEVVEVDMDGEGLRKILDLRDDVDAAFVALHGRWGEDGTVQGVLELAGLPYTGSGVMASALAMNKNMTKTVARAAGIPVVEDVTFTRVEVEEKGVSRVAEGIVMDLGLPCMVKPNCEGSTLGAAKVLNLQELEEAVEEALHYDQTVMVERFIEGREMTVGIVGEPPRALPVLEVVASKGVYDYECKYTRGMTEYRVPAPIGEELGETLQRLALKAHKVLQCEGVSRVDFMVDREERPYFLEVNTIPGMTELSLVPKAAKAAGMDFDEVVAVILESASLKVTGPVYGRNA